MSKVICEKDDLVAIADATRQATGSTETYNIASLRSAVVNTFAQGVGGGSADWAENNPDSPSYVKNRTHWMEEGQVSIWDNVVVTEADAENLTAPFNYPLEIGKTYTVIYNGTEYICECGAADLLGSGTIFLPALGSWEFILTEDVSLMREPFVIIALTDEYKEMAISQGVPAEYIQHLTGMAISFDGAEPPWTFSIIGDGTVYHKLNPRFLPDGGVGWIEKTDDEIIVSGTITQEDYSNSDGGIPIFTSMKPFEVGKKYTVDWNGEKFECEGFNFSPSGTDATYPAIGDPTVGSYNGIPFFFAYTYGVDSYKQ